MRLLITDPLHPAVPGTVAELQTAAAVAGASPWTVLGLVSDVGGWASLVPPPGVTELVSVPDAAAPGWRSRVVTLAVQRRVEVVLPLTDRDARVLAPAATELRELGVALACPPAPLVELAGDKWQTAVRLSELGIPTPESRAVDTTAELAVAARELGYPKYPLLLTPRRSAGGRGVWLIQDDAGLGNTSPPPALPLYPLMVAASRCAEPLGLVVQQQLPGVEVDVDVLAQDGKVLSLLARSRTRTLGGLCVGAYLGPVRPAVAELVERLVAALGWSQLVTIELIWDPGRDRGAVYGLNVRAPDSIGSAGHVGIPMLAAALELAITGTAPPLPAAGIRTWVRRYWTEQSGPA